MFRGVLEDPEVRDDQSVMKTRIPGSPPVKYSPGVLVSTLRLPESWPIEPSLPARPEGPHWQARGAAAAGPSYQRLLPILTGEPSAIIQVYKLF